METRHRRKWAVRSTAGRFSTTPGKTPVLDAQERGSIPGLVSAQ